MTLETPEPSDQLPEEAPEGQAPDDTGSSSEPSSEKQARDEADVREGEEQATGDRKSAG